MARNVEEKILEEAKERWREANEADDENRIRFSEDVSFCAGDQWDDGAKKEREGRPTLTINKTMGIVKAITGDQRQNKPSIKVRPADSNTDPMLAEVLNGLIRNIESTSNADAAYNLAFDHAVMGNRGYIRVLTEYADDDVFEQDICIKRVLNPANVYLDPAHQEIDGRDAKFCFVSSVMRKEDFEAKYPDADSGDWETGAGEYDSDWFTKDSVRVVEYYYFKPVTRRLLLLASGESVWEDEAQVTKNPGFKEGEFVLTTETAIPVIRDRKVKSHKLMWCKMTGGEILEGPIEQRGKYIPVVPVIGDEMFIDGRRELYSAIHHAKESARIYNWMASTSVETIALAPRQPMLVTPEQIKGHERQWNSAHRSPSAYLLYNPSQMGKPSREPGAIPDTGAINERQLAADDIKATTGKYDASLGARGNETSGRAIIARQRQGDTATYVFIDNLATAIQQVGRVIVDLIPHIYDSERAIRILDQDGGAQFVQINKTIINPRTGKEETLNNVTVGKYDVVVDIGPSYSTQRQEAADAMLSFIQAYPAAAPVLGDLIAKQMDWQDADEIQQRLMALLPPQLQENASPPQPSPEEMMRTEKMSLDIEGKQISNEKAALELQEKQAEMVQLAQAVTLDTLQQLGIIPTVGQ